MKKLILIGVAAVILIGGGGYLVLHKKPVSAPASETFTPTNSTDTSQSVATITYSSSGFSPSAVSVKAGDTVTIINSSTKDLQLDSDPHPMHTDDTDLNVGEVAPGQSKTFTVSKKGTFGYHNHLRSSDKAKITIE